MFIIITRLLLCIFVMFWLKFYFDFINFFFIIIDRFRFLFRFFIVIGFYLYYLLNTFLLKVTLLIMLLNSENSNILDFFLLGIRSLVAILLFLVFPLFNLLGNWLLLLDRWLLGLLILVVNHFVYFIFVVLIIFLPLIGFITVRQWRVIQVSHSIVELSLDCLVILVILVN